MLLPLPLEAMACQAVYLTADHSGFQESIAYERLDINDVELWLELTRHVLSDDALREELVEQGRRHVQSFSWTRTAQDFVECN